MLTFQLHVYLQLVNSRLALCLNSVLNAMSNVKARVAASIIGAFNQESAPRPYYKGPYP